MKEKEKILIIEDDSAIRLLDEKILTSEGYEVETADNGAVASRNTRKAGTLSL